MNKQKIIDYIELLEAKAYQSDDYFKQRNELYILNQKYKEVLDKIKEKLKKHKPDLDYEPWSEYKISGNILFDMVKILEEIK